MQLNGYFGVPAAQHPLEGPTRDVASFKSFATRLESRSLGSWQFSVGIGLDAAGRERGSRTSARRKGELWMPLYLVC